MINLSNRTRPTDSDLPPFSCQFSPNIPHLLEKLNCTLAITTYQAGKLIFLCSHENGLIQLPRDFHKAMGLAVDKRRLAVATRHEVVVLADAEHLAPNYAGKGYDALYLPRSVLFTGELDIHDMSWGCDGLYAVNTRFSCISVLNDNYSFVPVWKPYFIETLVPDDLCHLNGMAMDDGQPKYVSMLGRSISEKGWRNNALQNGLIMDVSQNQVVAENLAMPHSPRIYNGKLFCLLSAKGELVEIDVKNGKYEVVHRFNGFVRGMSKMGEYVFVGLSKIRKNTSTFRNLPIADKSLVSGIAVIHLPSGKLNGSITYQASVEEIYDVQLISGKRRPGILNHYTEKHRNAINTPIIDFWNENHT